MDIEIFPTGGDLIVLPKKIIFPDSITRDVLHKEKVDNCYRSTTWHALAKNCPKAASTKADVTGSEQHKSPRDFSFHPSTTPPPVPPPHTPLIRTPSPNEAFTDVDKHQEIPSEPVECRIRRFGFWVSGRGRGWERIWNGLAGVF